MCRGVYYTGWRRLIGSPKLQMIFHKRATKYRSLLRKMTYKDKGSYESSPPCIISHLMCSEMYSIVCWHMCSMKLPSQHDTSTSPHTVSTEHARYLCSNIIHVYYLVLRKAFDCMLAYVLYEITNSTHYTSTNQHTISTQYE